MTKRIDLSPRNATEKTGLAEKIGIALFVVLIVLPILAAVSGALAYVAINVWLGVLALL